METQKQFINPRQIYLNDLIYLIKDKTHRLRAIFITLDLVYAIKTLEDLLLTHPEELGKKNIKMGYESIMELLNGILENFEFVISNKHEFLHTNHGRYWNINKTKLQEINKIKKEIINTNKNLVDKYYQTDSTNPSNVHYLRLRSIKISIELEKNQQIIQELNKKNEELNSEQTHLTELLRIRKN